MFWSRSCCGVRLPDEALMNNCNGCAPPPPPYPHPHPYTPPRKKKIPKSKRGLWCSWMVPVVIVWIRPYHWGPPPTPPARLRTLYPAAPLMPSRAPRTVGTSLSELVLFLWYPLSNPFCCSSFFFFHFFFFFFCLQYSQAPSDKDDGWGRTLAPAKTGSFLGAERYWGGGGGGRRGGGVLGHRQEVEEVRGWGGGS